MSFPSQKGPKCGIPVDQEIRLKETIDSTYKSLNQFENKLVIVIRNLNIPETNKQTMIDSLLHDGHIYDIIKLVKTEL